MVDAIVPWYVDFLSCRFTLLTGSNVGSLPCDANISNFGLRVWFGGEHFFGVLSGVLLWCTPLVLSEQGLLGVLWDYWGFVVGCLGDCAGLECGWGLPSSPAPSPRPSPAVDGRLGGEGVWFLVGVGFSWGFGTRFRARDMDGRDGGDVGHSSFSLSVVSDWIVVINLSIKRVSLRVSRALRMNDPAMVPAAMTTKAKPTRVAPCCANLYPKYTMTQTAANAKMR